MSSSAATDHATFLRACLRLRREPAGRAAVEAAAHTLTDAGLQAAIVEERVGPLLHRAIGRLPFVPPPVAAELHRSAHATTLRNLLLLRELGRCLKALSAAAVPVIVLKGAALIETVYSNVSLRPMVDVDLLVPRDALTAMRHVLESLGYTLERIETHSGSVAAYENELTFLRQGKFDTWLDVHWSLFDSTYYQDRIAMDWFWDTARSAEIAGVPTRVLGPEALIIHLCGHLALHHMGAGLLWWNDIAEVLMFYGAEIDWPELLARTQDYGLLIPVRTVLTRAADEWGAPVPADVLRELRAQHHSPTEQRVFTELTATQRSSRQRLWSDLRGMSKWSERVRFAISSIFPSPSYMRRRYRITNPLLLPFYYPYRWVRGLFGLG